MKKIEKGENAGASQGSKYPSVYNFLRNLAVAIFKPAAPSQQLRSSS